MKKLLITVCLFAVSLCGFSQSCEERETKLLGAIGSFSAGFLYNSYGVIGSISDGYVHDAYNVATVTDLMDAQKKLMDNMGDALDDLVKANALKDQEDKDYVVNVEKILKGLRRQAQLLLDYTTNKSTKKQDDYDDQRKENWAAISKLMGLK